MCSCGLTPEQKRAAKDVVTVTVSQIQNIPIPVKRALVYLIPEEYVMGNNLLVTTRKQKLDLPRKLAQYLKDKYPDNFTF